MRSHRSELLMIVMTQEKQQGAQDWVRIWILERSRFGAEYKGMSRSSKVPQGAGLMEYKYWPETEKE